MTGGPKCFLTQRSATLAEQIIDESRPYQIIYGHSEHRYEQDGHKYDATKTLMKPGPIVTGTTTITKLSDLQQSARTEFPQDETPPVTQLTVDMLFWQIDWKKIGPTDTVLLKKEFKRLTGRDAKTMRRDHLIAALRAIYTSVARALSGPPAADEEAPETPTETPETEIEESPAAAPVAEVSSLRSFEL